MKIKQQCEICGKELKLKEDFDILGTRFATYTCGHTFPLISEDSLEEEEASSLDFTSCTGTKKAFDFQKDGVQFIIKSGFNCLIADPMGLGKTIQALLAARALRSKFRKVLCIVKSATIYQWYNEIKEWFDPKLFSATLINGTKSLILPGFDIYIVSMDTLSRIWKANNGTKKNLLDLGIDLVIVDECHSFKDPSSARTQALVQFLQDISVDEYNRSVTISCAVCDVEPWTEKIPVKINLRSRVAHSSAFHITDCPQCGAKIQARYDLVEADEDGPRHSKGVILLSGTPIKNRAEEYFVPLNILRPDLFTSLHYFRMRWLEQDPFTKKWMRLNPQRIEAFREMTKDFIIRREKNEVLALPPFRRTFETIAIDDPDFKKAYNQALAIMEIELSGKEISWQGAQGHLMTLRKIIGRAKVQSAVEYVEEFLDSVEDEKIAIGIHHEDVRDALYAIFEARGWQPLKISGEDSAERKNRNVIEFNKENRRVMIINIIAGGVGLNLQMCNNALILEIPWSAADEEQFEGRFNRQGQTRPVHVNNLVAKGIPIEDFLWGLKEQKRLVCGEALDGWDVRSDPEALRELINMTLRTKL